MKRTASANGKSKSSIGSDAARRGGYVLCVDNSGYEASLEQAKIYRALPNRRSGPPRGWFRVIDESGEDYLFPPSMFVPLEIPAGQKRRIAAALASAEG